MAVWCFNLPVSGSVQDRAWSNLVWWEMSLPMAGVWNRMIFKVPANPNHPVIL